MERRDFLKVITVGAGAGILNACAPEVVKKIATLTPTNIKPTLISPTSANTALPS